DHGPAGSVVAAAGRELNGDISVHDAARRRRVARGMAWTGLAHLPAGRCLCRLSDCAADDGRCEQAHGQGPRDERLAHWGFLLTELAIYALMQLYTMCPPLLNRKIGQG